MDDNIKESKICKVIMLPTKTEEDIFIGILKGIQQYFPGNGLPQPLFNTLAICGIPDSKCCGYTKSMWEPQHLYFMSDDEIKEGDWILAKQTDGSYFTHRVTDTSIKNIRICDRKIIATTDESLKQCQCGKEKHKMSCKMRWALPNVPESFLVEFVNSQGKINEVSVEYEISPEWLKENPPFSAPYPKAEYVVKTNTDNTIIIK